MSDVIWFILVLTIGWPFMVIGAIYACIKACFIFGYEWVRK